MKKFKVNILPLLPVGNVILNIAKQNEESNLIDQIKKRCQIATIMPARIKLKSVILSQARPLGIRRL
ncbi:MAG: hypothetical protein GQ468_03345 [Candidatus Scalindua sp.]|nr:hypothetical protein [Candidatus Scalindua sp.]